LRGVGADLYCPAVEHHPRSLRLNEKIERRAHNFHVSSRRIDLVVCTRYRVAADPAHGAESDAHHHLSNRSIRVEKDAIDLYGCGRGDFYHRLIDESDMSPALRRRADQLILVDIVAAGFLNPGLPALHACNVALDEHGTADPNSGMGAARTGHSGNDECQSRDRVESIHFILPCCSQLNSVRIR